MPSTVVVDVSPRSAPPLVSRVLASVRDLARSDPGRVALVGDAVELGYGELWRRATETADCLGKRPGVVGVPAVHHPITVVSLLGVWAAGGTHCPVDPSFPDGHADALLASVSGRRLCDALQHMGAPGRHDGLVDDGVAYVLFTSGSTGRPKPVAVPHRALDAVVPALVELFGITADDRVLQFASLNWDTAFEEILPTLAAGGLVTFGADAHSGSLPRLLRMVDRTGITVLDLPTAVWHELVLHLGAARLGLPDSVRLVVIGGEALNPARLETWRGLPGVGRIRLLNTYGATETTLITHAVDLHGPGGVVEGAPIGRPLAHVVQRVAGDGELLVAGPSLAVGYPGLPEATAERFVELGGERFYRTGDVVRESPDGLLHHLGRLDSQVKVRGVRVDPGEVEAQLLRHRAVAAAAVIGVTVSDHTALAAYVVAARRQADDPPDLVADLRAFLRTGAPCHLQPALIAVVPALVLTASGKVDRRGTHGRYGTPRPGSTVPLRAVEATT